MRRWLAAVGAVGLAALAPAADPGGLARQLGAPAYADRETAARALAALGPAALPALEDAVRSANPEVVRRAVPLLARARLVADSAVRLRVKPIRLDYNAVPLASALADLRERTSLDLRLDPAGVADVLRPVTCETPDLPPWEAVAAFARAAGVREVVDAEVELPRLAPNRNRSYYAPPPPVAAADVPIRFVDGTDDPPAARSSAVRVVVLPPSFPGGRVDGQRTLHFDVVPLFGLKWEGVTDVRIGRAIDDTGRAGARGHDAPPPPPAPEVEVLPLGAVPPAAAAPLFAPMEPIEVLPPTTRPNPRVVAVPVRPGSAAARVLTVFEGEVLGEVTATDQELAALAGVSASRSAIGPGGRLSVADVDARAKSVRVVVRLEVPSPWVRLRQRQPDGPLWPDVATPVGAGYAVRAFDAAGRTLPAGTYPQPVVSDDGAMKSFAWVLSYPAVPARLVATGPRVIQVTIPFTLANVPLP